MMNKKRRKYLSFLVCAMLAASAISTTVFATETTNTPSEEINKEILDDFEETEGSIETFALYNAGNGDKTQPGYVDDNNGHPRKVYESFDFVVDDIAYKKVDGGVEVAPWYWKWAHSCTKPGGNGDLHTVHVWCGSEYANREIVVPKMVKYEETTYPVVGIGDSAFNMMGGHNISSVTLPDSIQYIGDSAFYTAGITSINIPASVTSIGSNAFAEDKSTNRLSTITFSEGSQLKTIGREAFRGCRFTSIDLPNSVTTLGSLVFKSCDLMPSVTIPASVTNINVDTFDDYYCNGNVVFANESIFKIKDGVLYDSETLIRVLEWTENVVVPDGIKYINDDAFNAYDPQHNDPNAYILKSIKLPDSLISIGGYAFRSCKGLTEITIPKNVTTIGTFVESSAGDFTRGPFLDCTGLKKVTVLAEVTELSGTFQGCSSLSNVKLPDTLKVIGKNTFKNCPITFFDFTNIEEIGSYAFSGTKITEFIGGDKLTTIGSNAFRECSELETVIVPSGITILNDYIFVKCNSIVRAVVPASITSVGKAVFGDAFTNDATIIMQGSTPPTFATNAFQHKDNINLKIIVPTGSENSYAQVSSLKKYLTDDNGNVATNQDFSVNIGKEKVNICLDSKISSTLTIQNEVPIGATLEVTSDDENIATIIEKDNADTYAINAISTGTVTIRATIKLNGIILAEDICNVTVSNHNSGTEWKTDDNSHWHLCTICESEIDNAKHTYKWVIDKKATDTEKGSKHEECEVCGYKKASVEIPALGHEYKDTWSYDGTKHWYECQRCDSRKDEAEHTFKWIIDKKATDTEKGSKHEECEVCGYKKASVEIPALGHDYKDTWSYDGAKHWYECQRCDSRKDETEHTFKWIIDKKATDTEKGSKHEECEVCGYKKASVEIPTIETKPNTDKVNDNKSDTDKNINKPNTDKDNVKTGDNTNLGLYTSMLVVSGLIMGIVWKKKKLLKK